MTRTPSRPKATGIVNRHWTLAIAMLSGLLALVAAAPAQAAPNGLDFTFGGDGKVTTDFAGAGIPDRGRAVAIQPDGKIIVVGDTAVPLALEDFGLARYNRDGTLDTTFGGDGKVTTDFGIACAPEGPCGGSDFAQAVALQPDGKVVVAGWTVINSLSGGGAQGAIATDFALARYNADGTLDTTFGGDGKVTTDFGGNDPERPERDTATSVAIQPDGKIVAAGNTNRFQASGLALARYNADGTRDATFGGDGKVTTRDGVFANGVAIQPNGGILLAGAIRTAGPTEFVLARYTPGGALDDTFGGDGKVVTDFTGGGAAATSLALQPDGRIVAAGGASVENGGALALARYNVDGTLDSSFGSGGKVVDPGAGAQAVAIHFDGSIVAAGSAGGRTTNGSGFALARYNADGTLAANGGDDGKVTTDFGGDATAVATGMAIQSDGRIVLAGYTRADIPCTCVDSDFALARYKAAGSWRLDPPGHREIHPCVNGSFVDLNAAFGVPEQFACGATINAGERWRPLTLWFVGDTHYEVPPDYVPSAETPLEDLVAKLDAVKVVVDGGTKHERTTVFSPAEALRTDVTWDQLAPHDPEVPPFPVAATLPRMGPLKVGEHTVEVVWVLDAMHCDGLGAIIADNCLPAGEVPSPRRSVTVAHP